MQCVRGKGPLTTATIGLICSIGAAVPVHADGPIRSDLFTVFGHYHVTNGFSDRTFATTWGNAQFANGLGVHAEAHYVNREEEAAFFAAGVSHNTQSFSIRAMAGTSTDNFNILPEVSGRLEATFRSPPETGWVFAPALAYREYPNHAHETEWEGQILKYVPLGKATSLIFQGLARTTWIHPGDHFVATFGGGVTYAEYRKFSVGVTAEAGRTAYDATLGIGSINEPYVAVRPAVGVYLTDKIELVAQGEFVDRPSYQIWGGHLGLKFYFD
jgi:YaiO family outer membrane protein